jgi:hypothetical protein
MAYHPYPDQRLWNGGYETDQAMLISAFSTGHAPAVESDDRHMHGVHSGSHLLPFVRDATSQHHYGHPQPSSQPAASFPCHQHRQSHPHIQISGTQATQPSPSPYDPMDRMGERYSRVAPSPLLTRKPLRETPPEEDTVRMERMMQVFPVPPGGPVINPVSVNPRVFVHQMESDDLVEVDDPEQASMPWLLDDDTDAGAPVQKVKVFQCKVCRKWFDRPSALLTHESVHSGDKRQPLRRFLPLPRSLPTTAYKCPHASCDRYFSVPSNARRHHRSHG